MAEEKKTSEEQCFPCGISVSAGVIIKKYCKSNCEEVTNEFMKGNMTLRELAKRVNADNEILDLAKDQGVKIDMTLNKAVEHENKKPSP